MKNLVLAGGVALNCVANSRVLQSGPFDRVWIQPAAGDAGGALGAALFVWHQLLERPRVSTAEDGQNGSQLGPSFTNDEIRSVLEKAGACFKYFDEEALDAAIARLLGMQKVIGLFQGRMEFGPRALGNRSIIGDPRDAAMQTVMNLKIKFRESFRPFAPSVLTDSADRYFDVPRGGESPYMLLVAPLTSSKRLAVVNDEHVHGLELLKMPRSEVPAVTHVDYSARLQTVDAHRYGRYYRLIKRFAEDGGCPLVINTSFNVRGEPLVCTPDDALRCFMNTEMDALVLENHLLLKSEQPVHLLNKRAEYIRSFPLD